MEINTSKVLWNLDVGVEFLKLAIFAAVVRWTVQTRCLPQDRQISRCCTHGIKIEG
jgi:hypothetical protein